MRSRGVPLAGDFGGDRARTMALAQPRGSRPRGGETRAGPVGRTPQVLSLWVPLSAFGKPLAFYHWWLWRVSRVLAWLCGGPRVTAADALPQKGPAVVIAPHLSFFDPLFLLAALPRPSRFVAAAFYVSKNPILSWLLFLAGVIPVQRHRPDATALRQALRLLAAGEIVAFFPEGGRTWTGVPNLPMPAAVKFLMGLRVPIYVATVDGSYDYWPRFDPRPRARRVRVRFEGPLSSFGAPPAPGGRGTESPETWWARVYMPQGGGDVARAAEAIRSRFIAAAAGEPGLLRLEIPRRLEAVTRLLCLCPECAAAPLQFEVSCLRCPSCGLALHPAGKGRLLSRSGRTGSGAGEVSLQELVERMLVHLEARTRRGLCLEESVEAGEGPIRAVNVRAIRFAPASARLDGHGLRIVSGDRAIHLSLQAVTTGSMVGSETLEIPRPQDEMVLYVRAPGGAMRIVLAARAFHGLPFETLSP